MDEIQQPQQDLDYLMESPQDLHELYMRLRLNLSKTTGFFPYYMKLFSLIDIGSQLLPDKYTVLKEEIEDILEDDDYYIQKRQMEKDGDLYRLGGDGTGLIMVRSEEISYGLREATEQQAAHIIPRLKRIDNRIFRSLVEENVIERKRPILEELLIEQTMAELSKHINTKGEIK